MLSNVKLRLNDDQWEPVGEIEEGVDDPKSCLLSTLWLNDQPFHITAIQVIEEEGEELAAVNGAYQDDIEHMYGLCGGALSTQEIMGQPYVIVIYPFEA